MQLTQEQIRALLDGQEYDRASRLAPGHVKFQYPPRDSKYIRWAQNTLPCTAHRCKIPSYLRIQGLSYCDLHGFFALAILIEQLELNRVPLSVLSR